MSEINYKTTFTTLILHRGKLCTHQCECLGTKNSSFSEEQISGNLRITTLRGGSFWEIALRLLNKWVTSLYTEWTEVSKSSHLLLRHQTQYKEFSKSAQSDSGEFVGLPVTVQQTLCFFIPLQLSRIVH